MKQINGIFLLIVGLSISAFSAPFPVKDNMIWIFFGNSIVNQQKHTSYFESYYHLRYPAMRFHFRAMGRGGDDITEAMGRYSCQVDAPNPDYVSTMFGMNDRLNKSTRDSSTYANNLGNLVSKIKTTGATPVLFTPNPIYRGGGGSYMKYYASVVNWMGQDNDYPYADIFNHLLPIWMQTRTTADSMVWQHGFRSGRLDEIHPGRSGHLAMAYGLLKAMDAPEEVSSASIDAYTGTLTASEYCSIKNIVANGSTVSFDRLDERLPMAFEDTARASLKYMPEILDSMNRYMLTVTGLPFGDYDIFVDGELSATVPSTELETGWNMTHMRKGPIHDQLIEVLRLIRYKEGLDESGSSLGPPFVGNEAVRQASKNGCGSSFQQLLDAVTALDIPIRNAAQPIERHFMIQLANSDPKFTSATSVTVPAGQPIGYRASVGGDTTGTTISITKIPNWLIPVSNDSIFGVAPAQPGTDTAIFTLSGNSSDVIVVVFTIEPGTNVEQKSPGHMSSLSIRQPSINAKGNVSFSVAAGTAGAFSIAIYDMSGREIWQRSERSVGNGIKKFVWKTDSQSNGIYFVAMKMNGNTVTKRFVVLR